MKTIIHIGLVIVLVASGVSIHAADTIAQAAARAALEQKLKDLDQPQNPPAPRTSSWADVDQPSEPIIIKSNAVEPKAAAPQTTSAITVMLAAPPSPVIGVAPTNTLLATPTTVLSAPPKPTVTIPALKVSSPPARIKPTNEIVTIYGTVYKNTEVEKVDPDGVIISYSTAGGGMGMTKVYFTDLPLGFRQQYGKN